MKIKSDFVTNSSSTGYVVFIPDNFKIKESEIEEYGNKMYVHDDDKREGVKKQLHSEIPDAIETLKQGDYLWTYGDEGINHYVYYAVLDICSNHGFVVSSSEFGGEGNNSIFGIKQEHIMNILLENVDFGQLLQQVNKGSTLCCEETRVSH